MHQVDPAGDRSDAVDASSSSSPPPKRGRCQAEADALVADTIPKSGDRVEIARYRILTAGCVLILQIDRHARCGIEMATYSGILTLEDVGPRSAARPGLV